jgi:hypothetical protein
VMRRSRDNIEAVELYVQREQGRKSTDPTTPAIAGG